MEKKRGIRRVAYAGVAICIALFLLILSSRINSYGAFIEDEFNLINGSAITFSNIGIQVGDYLVIDGVSHKIDKQRIEDILIKKESASKEKIVYWFKNLGEDKEIQFVWASSIPPLYDRADDLSLDKDFSTDKSEVQFFTDDQYKSYMSFEDVKKTFGGVKLDYDAETRMLTAYSGKVTIKRRQEIVMDPSAGVDDIFPSVEFVYPTPKDKNQTDVDFAAIRINTTEENLARFIWDWNNINYTFWPLRAVLIMDFENLSMLGESNTFVKDMSGKDNDGTIFGASYGVGKYGRGLDFEGEDYLNIPDSESLELDIFTIEFWFRPDIDYVPGSKGAGLIYGNDYEIYIENGKMLFTYKGSSVSSTIESWDKGRWYHVIATYDGVQKLIIDGEREASLVVDVPFKMTNSGGEIVAAFLNSGDILLRGACHTSDCSIAPSDSFVIDDGNTTLAYIDSEGNLCSLDCDDKDDDCDNPSNLFSIKDENGKAVSAVNPEGLCLTGDLIENGI